MSSTLVMSPQNGYHPQLLLALIVVALARGTAKLEGIYRVAEWLNPEWHTRYRSRASFRGTIRAAIELHCPQSKKYRHQNPALFANTSRGEYRYMDSRERKRFGL